MLTNILDLLILNSKFENLMLRICYFEFNLPNNIELSYSPHVKVIIGSFVS